MMNVKRLIILVGTVTCLFFIFRMAQNGHHESFPQPSDGIVAGFQDEDGSSGEKRTKWLELMHKSTTGTDWKKVELENDMRRHQTRGKSVRSRSGQEVLANGNLVGEWKELGSTNQAGSVLNTLYDAGTDEIYLISAGGSLFKGKRDGSQWDVVNQDLRFNGGMLEWLPIGTGRRMVAFIGRVPHYSDDDGQTWSPANGLTYADSWGNFHSPIVIKDSSLIYVLAKKDYWSNVRLYRSSDNGESYQVIATMTTSNFDNYRMFNPPGSAEVYLLQRSGTDTRIYRINHDLANLQLVSKNASFLLGEARANLTGHLTDSVPRLYTYTREPGAATLWFATTDFGENWDFVGELPAQPWGVGVYVCPSNPDVMLLGEVECFRSSDGGANWNRINHWWEYYDAPATMLHADMMHFAEFSTSSGEPFLLNSNHGGLSISYNQGLNNQNIGLSGLNVSQYYSLKSTPAAPYLFFGGSQDQGFQRGVQLGEGPYQMNQLISGDYGHIAFSKSGGRLWTVYPGGWVIVYRNLTDNGYAASWEMVSQNESVWIPPLHEVGNPQEDAVLMAGGHIDGSEGSHLVKLTFKSAVGQIEASQFPFDFRDASGGELSAIEVSPIDQWRMYAATTNGRFFRSSDGGETWEQSVNFIPAGHYLYGQTILASSIVPDRVILGGSGYDSPSVWISEDGGQTFVPLDEGLPPTLVFELCTDPEEQFLFAATENGPWVYVFDEQQWYDLAGETAPAQTYWSAQYIKSNNGGKDKVRFGTYGRGGWDLEIENIILNASAPEMEKGNSWKIFPNPTTDNVSLRFSGEAQKAHKFTFLNQLGTPLLSGEIPVPPAEVRISMSGLGAGLFYCQIQDENGQTVDVLPVVLHED